MEKELEMVSLANLGRGAAIEQFDEEFGRVVENILDPNTISTAERNITLKVILKPNDNRDFCIVGVACTSKLSPVKTFSTQVFIGRNAKGIMATEHNPQQLKMNLASPAEKIVAGIKKGEKE
jgi:hypothetical protein